MFCSVNNSSEFQQQQQQQELNYQPPVILIHYQDGPFGSDVEIVPQFPSKNIRVPNVVVYSLRSITKHIFEHVVN